MSFLRLQHLFKKYSNNEIIKIGFTRIFIYYVDNDPYRFFFDKMVKSLFTVGILDDWEVFVFPDFAHLLLVLGIYMELETENMVNYIAIISQNQKNMV